MAIYLDTNALPRSFRIADDSIDLLRALASELDQELVLPAVALEESVAECQREAFAAFTKLTSALGSARTFAEISMITLPDPKDVASRWRSELLTVFRVLETVDADAQEALWREAWRVPPAREEGKDKHGVGARDAAIWLSVKRDHLAGQMVSYLVTRDVRAFANPRERAQLHRELLGELDNVPYELRLADSVESILQDTGNEIAVPDELQSMVASDDNLRELLLLWRRESPPPTSFDATARFGSMGVIGGTEIDEIDSLELIQLEQPKAYEVQGRLIALSWSMWRFGYQLVWGNGPWENRYRVRSDTRFRLSLRISPSGEIDEASILQVEPGRAEIMENLTAQVFLSPIHVDLKGQNLVVDAKSWMSSLPQPWSDAPPD